MRCIVVQVTGLAGVPVDALGGKTPLEAAATPVLDELAARGIFGLTRTVAEHGPVTVSAATAAILGTDPSAGLPAPGVLAAAGQDVAVADGEVATCLDLVAIAEQAGVGPVVAETRFAGLGSVDAAALAAALDEALAPSGVRVHVGSGAQHVAVGVPAVLPAFGGLPDAAIGQTLAQVLAGDTDDGRLRTLLSLARSALWEHAVCVRLRSEGRVAPTDVWPWGAGAGGTLPAFVDHFGVRGAALSVVPLVRGVARMGGLTVDAVAADGGDVAARRVERALGLSETFEFVLLHHELVDVAGGREDGPARVEAITRFDAELLGPLVAALRAGEGDWRCMVLSDVTASCVVRRDTADPVPFVVASPRDVGRTAAPRRRFSERDAREEGIFVGEAHTLLERLLRR